MISVSVIDFTYTQIKTDIMRYSTVSVYNNCRLNKNQQQHCTGEVDHMTSIVGVAYTSISVSHSVHKV